MFDAFIAQLFVLSLLFISSARIFFTKNARIDSTAVLAPAGFITSVLIILNWGLTIPSMLVFIIASIVFFTNGRSLFRLSASLFVDRYSILFVSSILIELILICLSAVFLFVFRPVKVTPEKFDSVKKIYRLAGSVSSGFEIQDSFSFKNKTAGWLYQLEPKNAVPDNSPVIIFSGSNYATTENYLPCLLFLSQKGYRVLSADFYSPDLNYYSEEKHLQISKKIYGLRSALNQKPLTEEESSFNANISAQKYLALSKLALNIYGQESKIFLLSDNLSFDSINQILEAFPDNVTGFFPMSRIGEYKSSGYGFVEQSDILLARKLGLSRDKSLFIPRYIASKTISEIKLFMPEASEPEQNDQPDAL